MQNLPNIPTAYIVAGAAVGVALLWAMSRGATQTGQAVGGAAVDMVNGVLGGVAMGAGQIVGIPPTNRTQCQIDQANGNTWRASFSCPAGEFLSYLWR